jgi:N-acetylmuramoyl-L-alanine amidase
MIEYLIEKILFKIQKKGEFMSKQIKNKPKKRRINKKKLTILILGLIVVLFTIFKLTQGLFILISNIKPEKEVVENVDDLPVEKKFTVLIDPGHGGNDVGTESSKNVENGLNNVYEKDVALEISKKVVSKLSKYNDIEVLVTRNDDTYLSLTERINFANSSDIDASISIHLNAQAQGNDAQGVETYYKRDVDDGSKALAKAVQSSIVSHIDTRDRGIIAKNYDMVIGVKAPSILVETGFLSTPEEEKKLTNSDYQEQLAEGIVQGILSYLDKL